MTDIEEVDRITYAEAMVITGKSHGYLQQRAQSRDLTRIGGRPTDTWLSRTEVEQLALELYRRGQASDYWLTMTETAALLGVHRSRVYQVRDTGRLIAHRTARGAWLVRRSDALALYMAGITAANHPCWPPGQGDLQSAKAGKN